MSSPFTEIPEDAWLVSNELGFAFFGGYPVTEGHTLIVPHRVVPTWFEATAEEQRALMALVDEVKAVLDERFEPDGYNIGINAGEAAGQTVMHLHVHVIPRYRGDMPDPRGGVRHVIPWKGNYLQDAGSSLATGGEDDPFV
ncbi:MAG: HIT family protein, partial [Persicimonas sp.]